MVYLFGLLILLFVFVSIIPLIQMFMPCHRMSEEIQYKFPQELFDRNMDHLKYEHKTETTTVSRLSIQNRGSVRVARGNILTVEYLESRKEKAYSVELP